MTVSDKHLANALGILLILTLSSTLFFWPMYFAPFESGKTISFFLLIELALPVFLLLLCRARTACLTRNPIFIFLSLLVAITALSAALGIDPINSFLGTAGRSVSVLVFLHGLLLVLYLTLLFCLDASWRERLTNTLIVVATIVAVYSLLEYDVLPAFVSMDERAAGFMGNPIFLGAYLTIPLFIALARAAHEPRVRIRFLVVATIMGAAILASGTRGALMGLFAGAMFWAAVSALRTRQHRIRAWSTLAVIFLGSIFLLGGLRALIPNSPALTRLSDWSGTNVQTRLAYWDMSLRHWTDAPLLGVGMGNFYRVADQAFTPELYLLTDAWPDKPHNAFLEWLVTTGVIGLSIFLILVGLLMREGLGRRTREGLWLTAGLFAYLTQSAFAFYTIGDLLPFFFLIALLSPTLSTTGSLPSPRLARLAATLGVAIFLSGLFLLVIPYHRLVLAVGQGNRFLANDALNAVEHYARVASDRLMLDDTLLSKKTLDAVHSWTTTQDAVLPVSVYDQALASARRTTARHPLRATFWNDLARLTFLWANETSQPVTQEGIQAAQRAIELAPQRVEARRTLGYIWAQNGEYEKAREEAVATLWSVPNQPNTLWLIAQLDYLDGDETGAAQRAYEVFLTHPEAFDVAQLRWIVGLLAQQEAYHNVIDLYEAWVGQHPDDPTFLPNLAATYAQIGDVTRAVETAMRLKELDPSGAAAVDAFIESIR